MKNITIAKPLIIALSIGMACSAQAQLLGRGGAVGGVIGGSGGFGGQLSGMTSFAGRGDVLAHARPAAGAINTDELRQPRSASGEAGGNGADRGNHASLAGSVAQDARGTIQPLRDGAHGYARPGAATAASSAKGSKTAAVDGAHAAGSANGSANGAVGGPASNTSKDSGADTM